MALIRTSKRAALFTAAFALGIGSTFSALSAQTGAPAAGGATERIRVVNGPGWADGFVYSLAKLLQAPG